MHSESFIAGKDASLETSIATMQAKLEKVGVDACRIIVPGDDAFWRELRVGELRFFGQPTLDMDLAGCDMHQRLLTACGKLHPA